MVKRAVIITLVCLLMGAVMVSAEEKKVLMIQNADYANVVTLGAVPDDGKDDTEAFQMAAYINKPIFVPAGVYQITKTIELDSLVLMGAGSELSIIEADLAVTTDPIVKADRTSEVRDICLSYKEGLVTGKERVGERVAIYPGGIRWTLQRGSTISNVKMQNVGTGIYAPSTKVAEEVCPFSVTFESVSVIDFSFRGFDFQTEGRTGNVFRNLYFSSGKYSADSAFYTRGSESEMDICELTIEDSKLKTPISFVHLYAISATNINVISTELTKSNTAFLYIENSAGYIEGLNIINSLPSDTKNSFIRAGDNIYSSYMFDNLGLLKIENFNLQNAKMSEKLTRESEFISRKSASMNDFTIEIGRYRFTVADDQKEIYETFHCGKNIIVNK